MTTDAEVAEFYGYAREVWKVWKHRAGWAGRLSWEDAIQGAAAHCWAVREKYQPHLSSRRSFFTLCARRHITELARQKCVKRRYASTLSLDVRHPDGQYMIEPADQRPRPCEAAEHADELAHVMRAVQNLPPRQWYVTWQHRIQGLTLEQIGAELGVTRERARQIEESAFEKLTAALCV